MKMKLSLAGLAAITAGTLVAVPDYQNDFTTRTSAPAPSGEWLEIPYVIGNLVDNYNSTAPDPVTPFAGTGFQDSWFKATIENKYIPSVISVTNNSSGVSANQYLRFGHSADLCDATGIAHPFYNTFSTGVLRMQADLRAPSKWFGKKSADVNGNGTIRIMPIGAAALATPNWVEAPKAFMQFGLQKPNRDGTDLTTVMPVALSGNGSAGGGNINGSGPFGGDHWFRIVIDMDLEKNKFSGFVYDQGTDHPNLTDANGTKQKTFTDLGAYWSLAKAGPIAGFAIRYTDIKTVVGSNLGCPSVDNIVCSWKAPGATDFVKFYENDFSTRRYRVITPAGTTSHTYVREAAKTSTSYQPYANITASTSTNLVKQILPAYEGNNYVRQPEGAGTWRRANGGGAQVGVVTYASGNPALQFSDGTGTTYAIASQTLGEPVTSGKVCLSCDVRTPDKWYWSSYTGAYTMFGSDTLWGAHNSVISAASLSRYGIQAPANKTTQFNVTIIDAASSRIDETVSLKPNTWYRVSQVVDIDAWTMSGEIHEIGASPIGMDASATGGKVHEVKDAPMRGEKTAIAAFALTAYGAGASTKDNPPNLRHVYYDNVKVWKNWDESTHTGDLIYKDDFKTVTRYYASQMRGKLIGTYNMDNGQDHWIRRNNGASAVWITSGANPCVAAGDPASHSYAVQDLGSGYKDRVIVQADMRSPASWLNGGVRAAQIDIGGDRFLNGNRGTANVSSNKAFTSFLYGAFGFGNNSAQNGVGLFTGAQLRFSTLDENGAAAFVHPKTLTTAELSHWFRFKVTFDLKAGTYDVKVYDQGAHPASASTPNGSLYYSASGLKIRIPAETRGVTSICLNTYGNQYVAPYDIEDPGLALYDNLKVSNPKGLAIILR